MQEIASWVTFQLLSKCTLCGPDKSWYSSGSVQSCEEDGLPCFGVISTCDKPCRWKAQWNIRRGGTLSIRVECKQYPAQDPSPFLRDLSLQHGLNDIVDVLDLCELQDSCASESHRNCPAFHVHHLIRELRLVYLKSLLDLLDGRHCLRTTGCRASRRHELRPRYLAPVFQTIGAVGCTAGVFTALSIAGTWI